MTLDEIEQKARDYAWAWDATCNRGPIAGEIADAVLALLPVVRAAEAWLDRLQQRGARYLDGVPGELMDALDTLHTALSADGRMGEWR